MVKQFTLFEPTVYLEGKQCSKCELLLPLAAFTTASGGSYLRPECRACAAELARIRKGLKELHGQPPKDYHCPICECSTEQAQGKGGTAGAWVLDHDHSTDNFRGWLCHSCNRALGCFNDNIPRMHRAIDYIKGTQDEG